VTSLRVVAVTSTSITLRWTAPGDDGSTGTAASYDVRYDTAPLTAGTWSAATPAAGEPVPGPAGTSETFTITGLATATLYYVALTASDEASNTSGLSNVVQAHVLFQPAVAFLAERETVGVEELYVADLAGSMVVKLSGTMVTNGDVLGYQWSPDRTQVAYVADQEADGRNELYVVSAWGGTPVKASGTLVPGGWVVASPQWAPDGSRIAYRARQDSLAFELYTSFPDGTGNVKISGPLVSGGEVFGAVWSPDSARMAYSADQIVDGRDDLFVSSADGASNVQVSPALPPGQEVNGGFAFSPDGSRIGFAAGVFNGIQEIYTARPDGTDRVEVTGTFQAGARLLGWLWAPDGSRIGFYSDMEVDDQYELYTALPTVASSQLKVSGTLVGGGFVQFFDWAPDSSELAFRAFQNGPGKQELFVCKADGSGRVTVNGALVAGGVVAGDWAWAPDGSRILYAADQEVDNQLELYTSLRNGTGNVKVSVAPVANGDVIGSLLGAWSPSGSRVLYLADQEADERFDLYTSPPDTSVGNTRVSPVPVTNGDVTVGAYAWSVDGSKIVYLGDLDTDGTSELYGTDPTGSAGNVKLSGTLVAGGRVLSFKVR
jgi:Tol biopolymer transport system component